MTLGYMSSNQSGKAMPQPLTGGGGGGCWLPVTQHAACSPCRSHDFSMRGSSEDLRLPEPLQSRAPAGPSHLPRLGTAREPAGARACREPWLRPRGSGPSQAPCQAPHTSPSSGMLPASSQGRSEPGERWWCELSLVSVRKAQQQTA